MRHCPPAIALAFALLALCPALAGAQPSPDFLFGSPKGMIGVRSGWVFASANSDLFTFVQRQLTVDRKDFNAPAIGVDVEVAVAPRAERNRRVRLRADEQELRVPRFRRQPAVAHHTDDPVERD